MCRTVRGNGFVERSVSSGCSPDPVACCRASLQLRSSSLVLASVELLQQQQKYVLFLGLQNAQCGAGESTFIARSQLQHLMILSLPSLHMALIPIRSLFYSAFASVPPLSFEQLRIFRYIKSAVSRRFNCKNESNAKHLQHRELMTAVTPGNIPSNLNDGNPVPAYSLPHYLSCLRASSHQPSRGAIFSLLGPKGRSVFPFAT